MTDESAKAELHEYLQGARETLVWKLEGLGEYDIRRPMTPTGTNLLGLVKHSAGTEARYFGSVFERPHESAIPWLGTSSEPDAEHWATAAETSLEIVAAYRAIWTLSDATIDELPLDAIGHVPWWGGEGVTLRRVLVHVTAETQRHAGHADILRELLDGSAGLLPNHSNLPFEDSSRWRDHHARVDDAAHRAAGS